MMNIRGAAWWAADWDGHGEVLAVDGDTDEVAGSVLAVEIKKITDMRKELSNHVEEMKQQRGRRRLRRAW